MLTPQADLDVITTSVHWSPCVVVVDDDPAIRQLVSTKLRLGGMCVHALAGGHEVLAAVRNVSIDLVILDIVMPGPSGLQVLDLLRSDPATRDTPVILLTAKGSERHVAAGYRAGATDYITKPFSPSDLADRVRLALA